MDTPTPSPHIPPSIFPTARQDAQVAATPTSTAQTEHPAYALAFQDNDFLLREDLRPVRFQLELLKAELALAEADIDSTFVFYGSARIPAPEDAQGLIDAAKTDAEPSTTAATSWSTSNAPPRSVDRATRSPASEPDSGGTNATPGSPNACGARGSGPASTESSSASILRRAAEAGLSRRTSSRLRRPSASSPSTSADDLP